MGTRPKNRISKSASSPKKRDQNTTNPLPKRLSDYTACYEKIAADSSLSDKDGVDMRPACIAVFDDFLDDKLSNFQLNDGNDDQYDYNYNNAKTSTQSTYGDSTDYY